MALAEQLQDDFSVGMQTDVARHLIDSRGSLLISNGLLDDDGSIYLRGGSEARSNRRFGTGLTFVWDGWLRPGRRTLIASADDFGVLDSDDATPINLGGAGLTLPLPGRLIDELLFLPGGTIYGGSRKIANYTTGNVDLVNGSAAIVGHSTAFLANVDAGMLFRHGAERVYVVDSVQDDTHLTLADVYSGATDAAEAYTLKPLEAATAPYVTASIYGVAGGRLLWARDNNTIAFSRALRNGGPHSALSTDNWQLDDGIQILGIEGLDNDAIIFTTQGYRVIRNITLELTDALGALQQRLETPNRDLNLWGAAGVASYRGALVVPAMDGVYLVDSVSAPVSIGDGIEARYRDHVELGNRPGGAAVYNDHYVLPILSATGTTVEDTLFCRLDRPTESRKRRYWPWTIGAGAGCGSSCYAVRAPTAGGDQPRLLGAERRSEAGAILLDDFSSDTLTSGLWNYIFGDGLLAVSGGHLSGTAMAGISFITRSVDRPEGDFGATVKFHVGDGSTDLPQVLIGKAVGGDVLYGFVTVDSPLIGVYGYDASPSILSSAVISALADDTDYWLRMRVEGNLVTVELWSTDPVLGGTPTESRAYTLTGADATLWGADVEGDVGIGFRAQSTDSYIDEAFLDRIGARVLDCSTFFNREVDIAHKYDHDGSIRDLELVTRAYATGDAKSLNRVRKARLIYELFADEGDLPTLLMSISPGRSEPEDVPLWDEVDWDEFDWGDADDATWLLLDGFAQPDDGRNGHDWYSAERMRYATLRLKSSGPIARLALRSLEVFTAVSGRNRHTRVES